MDILLINPSWYQKTKNMWRHIKACMPPFGLGVLASVLEKAEHRIEILDCNAERIGLDTLEKRLKEAHWDMVGITATTGLFPNALKVAEICKSVNTHSPVVLGGVHPSVFPQEALHTPFVDFVIRNEGEETISQLASGSDPAGILGLSYKKNGGGISSNPARPPRPSITDLPMAAYHLLPMDRYNSALGSYLRAPSIGMVVSRGCPGRCTYCFGKYLGGKIRFRSADQIIEEITVLTSHYGKREISFYDDTFCTFPGLVRDVCRKILSLGLDITWSCFSRIDRADEKTLTLMKAAGCHQIMYGIESADPQILRNINKRIDLEDASRVIQTTRKIGINVRAAFMLGNPGETEESMLRTLRFAKKSQADFAVFNITTPFPGSVMFDWADRHGYLTTKDWSQYDLATMVMELPTVNPETVKRYYRKAYREFYLRPGYLLKKLAKIRSLAGLRMHLDAFRAILKF